MASVKCVDCKQEAAMLWSRPRGTHSVALCPECWKQAEKAENRGDRK